MTDAARRDYSWSVPNRRFIDSGLYLPSMHSEGIDAIAIIIDTSASLPGETLALFWAEVREIAAELQPDSIFVLQVDAVLQDAAQYPAGELPDSITIKGRAGPIFGLASRGSMSMGCIQTAASTWPIWIVTATPRPRPHIPWPGSSGAAIDTASPGASASTSDQPDTAGRARIILHIRAPARKEAGCAEAG